MMQLSSLHRKLLLVGVVFEFPLVLSVLLGHKK